jgi:hypothetical protein
MIGAWEYKVLTLEPLVVASDEAFLDELGADRWELVAVCPEARYDRFDNLTYGHVAYFKRRKDA